MLPENYHCHTHLCGHASGTVDDYILTAIKSGIAELGFSDHAPIPLPFREGITMDPGTVEHYIGLITEKKAEYSGRVQIRLGFEVDYPLWGEFDEGYFDDRRIDFLIGSCHFIDEWPFDHPAFVNEFDKRDIDEVYGDYYSILENLVDSGLFDIVGHFDLVKKFGHRPKKNHGAAVERIVKKISRKNMSVEINTSGLLKPVGEMYPSHDILKIFFENNVPITLGTDCHSPDLVDYGLQDAVMMIKKAGYDRVSGYSSRRRYDISL